MSQEEPRKRDRFRAIFKCGRPKSPGGRQTGRHSQATSESPAHISRANSPSTSVLAGAVAPDETTISSTSASSTQLFIPSIEPSVETESGRTILDTTINSSTQLHQQPKHRSRPRNDQADTATSRNVISSENTEKRQIYQGDAKHNEFIKPVLHGGQTFNFGAYVSRPDAMMYRWEGWLTGTPGRSESKIDDVQQRLEGMKAPEISQQRLVHSQYTSVQKIRDPGMGVRNPVHRTPQADQQGASRRHWRVAL